MLLPPCIHAPGPTTITLASPTVRDRLLEKKTYSGSSTLQLFHCYTSDSFTTQFSMGNNTSSTRKSAAAVRHSGGVRKLGQSQNAHQILEEEFSDLILHEVKRQKQEQSVALSTGHSHSADDLEPSNKHFTNDLIEDEFNELSDGILGTDQGEVQRNILPTNGESDLDLEAALSGDNAFREKVMNKSQIQSQGQNQNNYYVRVPSETNSMASGYENDGSSDNCNMDVDADATHENSISGDHNASAKESSSESQKSLLNDLSKIDFTRVAAPAAARHPFRPPQHRNTSGSASPFRRNDSMQSVTLTRSQNRSPALQETDNYAGEYGGGSGTAPAGKSVPVEIKWVNSNRENITKVSIIGSFSNWRDVIKLKPLAARPNEFSATIGLPLGVHKLLYIINNEYRVSELLPTATDQEGILFNWFEILDPQRLFNNSQKQQSRNDALTAFDANIIQVAGQHDTYAIQQKLNSFLAKVSKEAKDTANFEHVEHAPEEPEKYESYNERLSFLNDDQASRDPHEYLSEIPEMFVNYDYFKNKAPDYELPEPPQLPAHLNNVLLNKMLSNFQQNHAQNIPQVGAEVPSTSTISSTSTPSSNSKRPPLRRADSSYYASNSEALHLLIPNHVILNHLMTTSIRNDVLTVACITRYSGKFVTQIMHLPADTEQL